MKNGTDIIEISRIKESIKNTRFLSRVFSPEELKYFASKSFLPQTIAANFAAKEAFAKALGTGFRNIKMNEISVLRDGLGAPYITLSGKTADYIKNEKYKFCVSLSHCKEYAVANVIIYRD